MGKDRRTHPLGSLTLAKPQQELDRLKRKLDAWVGKQHPYAEVGLATLGGSVQGAMLGGFMGVLTKLDPQGAGKLLNAPPPGGDNAKMSAQMQAMQSTGPWGQARNFAVMTGVNAGLSLAVKKYRNGKEDVRGAMIAAFGSGTAFSLVSGMAGPEPLVGAFSTGVVFALLQGGLFQLGQMFSGPKHADENYVKGQHILQTVGFAQYQKKLKRGQLTDNTIMLWDNEALRDAGIPPGPRLLILHHVDSVRRGLRPGQSHAASAKR